MEQLVRAISGNDDGGDDEARKIRRWEQGFKSWFGKRNGRSVRGASNGRLLVLAWADMEYGEEI